MDLPLFIPEIDYPLPEVDGELVSISLPAAWLPFFASTLTEITDRGFHSDDESLYIENRQRIDAVIVGNTGGNTPHNNEPQYYVLRFAIVASL